MTAVNFDALIVSALDDFHDHVSVKFPDKLDEPFIRVTLIDGRAPGPALHHAAGYVQVDCYAGRGNTQSEALELGRQVVEQLHDLRGTTRSGVAITGVTGIGWRRLDDESIKPPRARCIVEATIHAHPAP
ncbi:MAG: hypothetical protein PGN13_16350 [Patulibacter minatonensis]